MYVGETFEVVMNITYPRPNTLSPARASYNATIVLPSELVLATGKEEKKRLLGKEPITGDSSQVSGVIEAKDSEAYNVTVFAEAIREDSVGG